MRLAMLTAAIVLAGCAGVPAEQVGDFRLCEYAMSGGNDGMVAQREAQRRGLDCRPLYGAILQKRANQNAAMNNALQYFNRPPPPLPAPHQSVHCRTVYNGNVAQTICN